MGRGKISPSGVSQKWVKSRRRRKKKRRKRENKKVGENNGQLRFVRHHMWRTQARLDQNEEKREKKERLNALQMPPRVAHAKLPGPKIP